MKKQGMSDHHSSIIFSFQIDTSKTPSFQNNGRNSPHGMSMINLEPGKKGKREIGRRERSRRKLRVVIANYLIGIQPINNLARMLHRT
jgi:hypothetical protein